MYEEIWHAKIVCLNESHALNSLTREPAKSFIRSLMINVKVFLRNEPLTLCCLVSAFLHFLFLRMRTKKILLNLEYSYFFMYNNLRPKIVLIVLVFLVPFLQNY